MQLTDPTHIRNHAQTVLDTEARYIEGTRTLQDVHQAWVAFARALEMHFGQEDWRASIARSASIEDPLVPHIDIFQYQKLMTCFGMDDRIGEQGHSEATHVVSSIHYSLPPHLQKAYEEKTLRAHRLDLHAALSRMSHILEKDPSVGDASIENLQTELITVTEALEELAKAADL